MSRDNYLYAAGVIRYLENKLLNGTDVERMVDAPDLTAAYKVFHDTDYFDNVLDVAASDYNQALEADLRQTKEKITEMTPDDILLRLLFLRHDFHNLKLAFKELKSGKDLSEFYSPLGNEEPVNVKAAVNGETEHSLGEYFINIVNQVAAQFSGDAVGPADIDRVVDQAYFKAYQETGRAVKSSWLNQLVERQIDIANIKIFLRAKLMGFDAANIAKEIIPSGTLAVSVFTEIAELDADEALPRLRFHLARGAQIAIDHYLKDGSLEQLEKHLENFELEYVREAKFIDYGPELVVAYYMAKKNAIRNVRLIMTGKANKLPAEEIKQLTREIY